jgi:predicted nicotinamide N-methyase
MRDAQAFVRDHTAVAVPPLVPELRLHLATEPTPLWEATEEWLEATGVDPPFWAFAWAGGQALARYLLDDPGLVRGRDVIDVGCGSGLVAIAAMLAGARSALAVDQDSLAVAAAGLNAALNGVAVTTEAGDATRLAVPAGTVVLSGDVCYARGEAEALAGWFAAVARSGNPVLVGDPGRKFLPKHGFAEVARYEVETSVELEKSSVTTAWVWRVTGDQCVTGAGSATP